MIVAAQRQHESATERMPVYPRNLKNWPFTLVCALTGVLIGAAVSSLSAFVLQAPGTRLARASFMATVAVRSPVDLVVFLAAIAVGQFLVPNHPPARPASISQRGHWASSGYAARNSHRALRAGPGDA
jgi:hypothetical protein